MFQPDHLNLLLDLLKNDYEAAIGRLARGGLDFASFDQFVAKHQLRGFVYSLLARSPARDAFPPELLKRLQAVHARQRTKTGHMLRELKSIASTFSDAGQEFILLKGLYLAQRFYGNLDDRALWDIDILVRREHLLDAERLLVRSGFQRKSRIVLSKELMTRFSHAFDFAKPGVNVDLHWALSRRPSFNIDYQDLWEKKRRFHLDDVMVYVLADEHALLFNLVSIFKDIETSKIRLRSFVDLYMMMKTLDNDLDWTQFLEARARENLLKISLSILGLFLKLFGCNGEFPHLTRALSGRRNLFQTNDPEQMFRLIAHSRLDPTHRLWTARLYQGSPLHFLFWWIISFPFRRAAYRTGKHSRLRRGAHRLRQSIGLKK